jgi:hypothetical protein
MRRVKTLLSVALLLFIGAAALTVSLFIKSPTSLIQKAASGTKLWITPANQIKSPGSDISFAVAMDTTTNNITGIDLLLKFDPSIFQISSLKRGVGVGALNNTISSNFNNTTGEISYAIFTLDKSQAINGSSIEVLQINAKVKNSATGGDYSLSFDNSSAVSATGENQNALVSITPGNIKVQADSSTPTPTATSTVSPTNQPTGAPNACGGTCGSNANCGSNLFCYQGFCRNPSCSWSSDCSCNQAATPVPTKTATPTSRTQTPRVTARTPRPTTSPVVVEYTPSPEPTPEDNFWENVFNSGNTTGPTPTIEPSDLPESEAPNYLIWIIGSLVVAGITLILIVIGILKEMNRTKAKPPVIKV